MIFLDFLGLYFCIVLLNARPVFKSMTKKDIAGEIDSLHTKYISKERPKEHKEQLYYQYANNPKLDLDILYPRTSYYRNKGKFKREVSSKEMNIKDFEIFKNIQDYQKYDSNLWKPHKSTAAATDYNTKISVKPLHENKNLKKIYGYDQNSFLSDEKEERLLENNNNSASDINMKSTNDDMEFLGTAEIETVLNEMKHREIQMITQNEPSVSDLISSTVTEATFTSNAFLRKQKICTGFSFCTFLPFCNHNKNITQYNITNDNKKQHNIFIRSLKEDSYTLANNIENMLQKKCKNVFKKIKNKLSNDYNKEVNKTKVTVKDELNKLCNKTRIVTNSSQANTTSALPETKSMPEIKSSLREKHYNRRNRTRNNYISTTSHSIPVLSDDYSMLSVFELLLTKSHENNVMNMLSTKSLPAKRRISPEKSIVYTNKKKNVKVGLVDVNSEDTTVYELNNRYNVTDDTSYEAISNKIAYNDYVNGYKYYLNYQKNYDDKKYSNLVRYQAHKHHKVDDIGKFILNKIPQLPTTRLKRKFVESDTLDDQEISTKSEDSWFKKHFFIFLDRDPSKKFHSSQTVTFKDLSSRTIDKYKLQNNEPIGTELLKKNTISKVTCISQRRNAKDNSLKDVVLNTKDMILEKSAQDINIEPYFKVKRYKRKYTKELGYRTYLKKAKTLTNCKLISNTKKVNLAIDSELKTLTTENKNDIKKRENNVRIPRFKFLKVVKASNTPKYSTRRQKLFDYEVVSDTYIAEPKHLKDYFKVEEMIKQVPNVSADFNILYPYFDLQNTKINNNMLKFGDNRQKIYFHNNPGLYKDKNTDYFIQDQSTFVDSTCDDIINVNYKTLNNKNIITKEYFLTYPTFATITRDSIRNEIENLRIRLTSFNDDNNKKDGWKKIMQRTKSPSVVTVVPRNHKNTFIFPKFNSQVNKSFFTNNFKYKAPTDKPHLHTLNKSNEFIPHKNDRTMNTNFRKEYLYDFRPTVEIQPAEFNQNKVKTLVNANTIPDVNNNWNYETKKLNKIVTIRPTTANYVKSYSALDSIINETPDTNMYVKNRENSNKKSFSKIATYKNIGKNKPDEFFKSYVDQNNFNNAINFFKIKSHNSHNNSGHTYTPPEQYFDTPIPMQVNEFDKFLKDHNIDVASVTSPLSVPVPKSVKSWKSNNKASSMASGQNIDDLQKSKTQKLNAQDSRRDIFGNKKLTCTTNYLYKINENRDPLRFTHMLNKEESLTSTNSSLRNLIQDKVKSSIFFGQDIPNRVQMKGHSFKYDIIIHKPYNNWNPDSDTYDSGVVLSAYKNVNDNNPIVDEKLKDRQRDQKAKSEAINFIPLNNFDNIRRKKYEKRALQDSPSFTAKDVAALEVVVDLLKSTQSIEEKDNALLNSNRNKNITYTPLFEKENQLNSIQVHIAIPSAVNDKRRSLESVNVRKVFTAIMSTPVDLEYQIHSFDETTNAPTTVQQNILSPGLYLLVENTNVTCPKGNFALKPMSVLETSNLKIRHATRTTTFNKSKRMNNTETISLNNKINKIVQNFTTGNETICKRNVHTTRKFRSKKNLVRNKKRNVNLDGVKRFFGHDRVCHCHCKVNKTMCRTCAESDKVISELIFEFNNLEKYVIDHCTEIQTFFWMNPTDGKKLRDIIHRIDKVLNDYYKRVKGKCQGRTCQMLSSNIDKRSFNIDKSDNTLTKKLFVILHNLQNVSNHIPKEDISVSGRKYLNKLSNCLGKEIYKRSFSNDDKEIPMKSIYSLNNIKINLICDTDTTKFTSYPLKNKIIETNTNPTLWNDTVKKRKEKKKKGLKKFFKNWSKKNKGKTTSFYHNVDEGNNNKILHYKNKRQLAIENKIKENIYPSLNCVSDNKNIKHVNNLNFKQIETVKELLKTNYAKRNIISSKKDNLLTTTKRMKVNNNNISSIKTNITTVKKGLYDEESNLRVINENYLKNTLQNINKLLNSFDFNKKGKRNKSLNLDTTSLNISHSTSTLAKKSKDKNKKITNEFNYMLVKLKDTNNTKSTKLTTEITNKLLQSASLLQTKIVKKTNDSTIKGTSKFDILNKLKNIKIKYLKSEKKKSDSNVKNTESHLSINNQKGKIDEHKTLDVKKETKIRKECLTNLTLSTNPTIIIFDDIALTDSGLYSTNNDQVLNRDKYTSLNKSNKSMSSYVANDVELNRFMYQSQATPKQLDDSIYSILNVTTSSILSTTKGLVDRIADKFSVKFVSNKKEKIVTTSSKTINTNMAKLNHGGTKTEFKSNKNIHKLNQSQLSISVSTSPIISPAISVTTKTVRSEKNKYLLITCLSTDYLVNIIKNIADESHH
ncbi:unnamed protein product [Euphydryas editha]|uniref:Uncharacterized protein n=1 Tax=Euphydryas editha TaxID=104508 RepID=A0AAU9VCL0_EUPED|nr:unnamed protein product [Euphydryas editha]